MRFRPLSLALLSCCFASACLGGTEPVVIPTIETTGFAASLGVDLAASTKTANGLYYRDIQVGTGTTLVPGQTVGTYYVGNLPNGTVIDARTSGTPLSFKLGAGEVIKGWDEGLPGMKVNGQRQLVIPPALAYGRDVLVFTVTAVSAQ